MGDGTEDVEGNLNPGPDASRTPSSADKHGGTRSGQNRQGKWEGENPDEGDSVSPATGSANRRGSLDHSDVKDEDTGSDEGPPPPLPPRPKREHSASNPGGSLGAPSLHPPALSPRPPLRTAATTALSLTEIQTHSYQDGSRETYSTSSVQSKLGSTKGYGNIDRYFSRSGSEAGDTSSIRSYVPTIEASGDVESLLGEVLGSGQESPAWKRYGGVDDVVDPFDSLRGNVQDDGLGEKIRREFEALPDVKEDGSNEEALLQQWRSRLKHFLILSSAGKPIYSRHGDQNLISSYIGVVQTIISFHEGAKDPLKGFTAGGVRFVVVAEGPLYLVAISSLGESDNQLRVQLGALYMQVLSTLTLPALERIFSDRPSSDLRRPLQGTEPLLSALADSFTKGSPSTLLSALECLKIRKSHRQVINTALLHSRTPDLLYGLIVAGGRLVSVVRPKKHSLHPSDLQLIFNMLFEAGGVKAGGGENWIPLCLPGFNKNGFLYMYVSFLGAYSDDDTPRNLCEGDDQVAILLISANKEGFYELKTMRDDVVQQLEKDGSMAIIKAAVRQGRPNATDIVPGTVIRHFLYKSRANVQFAMPSFSPKFSSLVERRRLLTIYHDLHTSVHAKNAHLKVHHCISEKCVALAWVTPVFELYCVAGPFASRAALAQGANKMAQWVKREEERVFIVGGAVF